MAIKRENHQHADRFVKRKSSIYKGKSPFSIFGIGDYSFSFYKVGISGLHKDFQFRIIYPVDNRPVMLDDTCYFISCFSLKQAILIASLLNNPKCLEFLRSRTFLDAKRPITKKLLQCINLKALLNCMEPEELIIQASAEYERLKTNSDEQKLKWSSSLEEFLVEHPPALIIV
ncbi:MAG: hypothetical protein ACHBN1_07775 [Heteroscytonema crispum UTEX LB 1556]